MGLINIIDLFAGAGGFGLGFEMASKKFKLVGSIEQDSWAVETLKANNKSKQQIICADIRSFGTPSKIKNAFRSSPDIIIGGPPCQGFSNASGRNDPKDPRNTLFKNFALWVDVLKPKVFVMENVKGLLSRKNENGEKVIDIIQKTFEKAGYEISIWELNAANFGVPQRRERVFIVGNLFGKKISKPRITHYLPDEKEALNGKTKKLKQAINVSSAISDLPELFAGQGSELSKYTSEPNSDFQRKSRKRSKTLFNHVTMAHTERVTKRYKEILDGNPLENLSPELQVRKRNGNGELSKSVFSLNYRHLKPDMIAYTIPASFYSNFIHPTQPRNITSREAARLQSFPDNYVFKGKRTQISSNLLKQLGKEDENFLSQYNQIGNAVPPLLAKAVAKRLLKFLNEEVQNP